MARIELVEEVADDIERIVDHCAEHGVADAGPRLRAIVAALDVLAHSPLIGRPVRAGADLRELIIGPGARGYVALYRWVEPLDTVFVLALRSQREAGYARD
jgi:plasmid stabilization system protein ParE